MAKWLTYLTKPSSNPLAVSEERMADVIRDGVEQIIRLKKNPMQPRLITGGPMEGVPVLHDEFGVKVFLAGLVAYYVRMERWGESPFYYECRRATDFENTVAFRAMADGLRRDNLMPDVKWERDVHLFDNREWLIGRVRIVLQ